MPLLITNIGQLITLAGSNQPRRGADMRELGLVKNGAVLINEAGLIEYAGLESSAPAHGALVEVIDAGGRCVTPGLIDSHTHLVFAGERCGEFFRRCGGESYSAIARAGGGIAATVAATRAASADELVELALPRLQRMLEAGTTTVEIKTGYGLSFEHEWKQLLAINRLRGHTPLTIHATYMGAHAIPAEFKDRRGAYIDEVVTTIPQVAKAHLADFVDVFVDPLAFTNGEALVIVKAAREAGLKVKLHGDEFGSNGTAEMFSKAGQLVQSIDHLGGISDAGIKALSGSETIATLLPGTMFFSGHGRYAPARRMIDAGCAVALATDLNPGSSHIYSLPFIMTLASLHMGMTAAECLTACTINAAHALCTADRVGSLEPGKRADLVIWDCASYEQLPYHVGTNLAHTVICGGQVVSQPFAS